LSTQLWVFYGRHGTHHNIITHYISYGFSTWFRSDLVGVVLCANGELGMITPPFGINVFVVRGLDKSLTLEMVFKGIAPFVVTDIIFLIILSVFPEIALALPRIMTY